MCGMNTVSCEAISFISRFYDGKPLDVGSFQPQKAEMRTNYETHNPGDDTDPKDVAPATQSVPHVPFVLHTTRKGIINNATAMETQKDIGVVKLNFHSVSSFSILITCGKHGTPWYYVLSSIDKTIANDVTNHH